MIKKFEQFNNDPNDPYDEEIWLDYDLIGKTVIYKGLMSDKGPNPRIGEEAEIIGFIESRSPPQAFSMRFPDEIRKDWESGVFIKIRFKDGNECGVKKFNLEFPE